MKRSRLELSKNLLQMKFMQRTKENVEREIAEQNESQLVDQELLELCRQEGDRYLTTSSHLFCENLRYGRMSFKGMNPEVERLMQSKEKTGTPTSNRATHPVDNMQKEVSDQELATALKRFKTRR